MPGRTSAPLLTASLSSHARPDGFGVNSRENASGRVTSSGGREGEQKYVSSYHVSVSPDDRRAESSQRHPAYHEGWPFPQGTSSSSRDMGGRLLAFPRAVSERLRGRSTDSLGQAAGQQFDDLEEEEEWCCCFPPLTLTERLLGWLTCFIGCLVISSLALGSFQDLVRGKSTKFAIAYTLGNCVGLLGTAFLVGFRRQLEGMTEKSRLWSSGVFAGSIMGTLLCAIFMPVAPLVILCLTLQWLAYIWYSLSYIPYGRESVLWCFRWVRSWL
ncbi:SFT2 domain containing 1, related [Neospora caninum Liverpool]|uniref:Vesicle transport protein n=1 Tax=Neospora caninum (strain Liverpool) TaxID=572307 RepID=F0VF53_NEOCL|nr:SFT2 domain containing 1, related [Neospora caninum Liverpool]CBZ52347.1 SFT2 domain containing 1, related [Neospora caninum Liverpool]CEL66316.1 TPA: SFT2 domain containing 1, related [Neospora caninum Liverpool]|eukprot:XP_003882379.1 SFT2 domain containing 1, related [Neospora caninum Liverpool]